MGATLDPVDEKTWLVPVDFLPPSCWPLSVAKVGFVFCYGLF